MRQCTYDEWKIQRKIYSNSFFFWRCVKYLGFLCCPHLSDETGQIIPTQFSELSNLFVSFKMMLERKANDVLSAADLVQDVSISEISLSFFVVSIAGWWRRRTIGSRKLLAAYCTDSDLLCFCSFLRFVWTNKIFLKKMSSPAALF